MSSQSASLVSFVSSHQTSLPHAIIPQFSGLGERRLMGVNLHVSAYPIEVTYLTATWLLAVHYAAPISNWHLLMGMAASMRYSAVYSL